MNRIGTHTRVTLYAVAGWRPGDPPEQRFGATCENCGVWRGPDIATIHDTLTTVPCTTPALPSPRITAEALAELTTPPPHTATPRGTR